MELSQGEIIQKPKKKKNARILFLVHDTSSQYEAHMSHRVGLTTSNIKENMAQDHLLPKEQSVNSCGMHVK